MVELVERACAGRFDPTGLAFGAATAGPVQWGGTDGSRVSRTARSMAVRWERVGLGRWEPRDAQETQSS